MLDRVGTEQTFVAKAALRATFRNATQARLRPKCRLTWTSICAPFRHADDDPGPEPSVSFSRAYQPAGSLRLTARDSGALAIVGEPLQNVASFYCDQTF